MSVSTSQDMENGARVKVGVLREQHDVGEVVVESSVVVSIEQGQEGRGERAHTEFERGTLSRHLALLNCQRQRRRPTRALYSIHKHVYSRLNGLKR